MNKLVIFCIVLILTGAGCAAPANKQAADQTTREAADSTKDEAYSAFQKANARVTELMRQAEDKGLDARPYEARRAQATLKSVSNAQQATKDMQKIVEDLEAALGQ